MLDFSLPVVTVLFYVWEIYTELEIETLVLGLLFYLAILILVRAKTYAFNCVDQLDSEGGRPL